MAPSSQLFQCKALIQVKRSADACFKKPPPSAVSLRNCRAIEWQPGMQPMCAGQPGPGEEAQKAFRVDVERVEATEQRWLREVDRAREEAKSAKRDMQTAQTKLVSETKRRLKLVEDLAHQKRILMQRAAEMKRQFKPTKKIKNSVSRKSTGRS